MKTLNINALNPFLEDTTKGPAPKLFYKGQHLIMTPSTSTQQNHADQNEVRAELRTFVDEQVAKSGKVISLEQIIVVGSIDHKALRLEAAKSEEARVAQQFADLGITPVEEETDIFDAAGELFNDVVEAGITYVDQLTASEWREGKVQYVFDGKVFFECPLNEEQKTTWRPYITAALKAKKVVELAPQPIIVDIRVS